MVKIPNYFLLINFCIQEIEIFFKTFQLGLYLCWAGCGRAAFSPNTLLQKNG